MALKSCVLNLCCILCFLSLCAEVPGRPREDVVYLLSGYRLPLGPGWQPMNEQAAESPVLAFRIAADGSPAGQLLGEKREGTVQEELTQITRDLETSYGKSKILSQRPVNTAQGVKGMSLVIQNEGRGEAFYHWHLMYPQESGGSVWLMLQFHESAKGLMIQEMKRISVQIQFVGYPELPEPKGELVTELSQLVGSWKLAQVEESNTETRAAPELLMNIVQEGYMDNGFVVGKLKHVEGSWTLEGQDAREHEPSTYWRDEDTLIQRSPDGRQHFIYKKR